MRDNFCLWLVRRLPKRVVYWAMIHGMASVNPNHPDAMKATDYLKALQC